MKNVNLYFIASVMEEKMNSIHDIAKNLETLGCKIDRVHTMTGIISGSVQKNVSLEKLKIDGIKYIEPDRKVGPYKD